MWVRTAFPNQGFWHLATSDSSTACGYIESKNGVDAEVEASETKPTLDVCGFCLAIERGDDPVFSQSGKDGVNAGASTNERRRALAGRGRLPSSQNGKVIA